MRIDITGEDFRIDPRFPHPTSDQLGVLGAEVDDQQPLRLNAAFRSAHTGRWGHIAGTRC